jgi:hypothetical protein
MPTPGNHPKERIQYSQQGGRFKSRNCMVFKDVYFLLPYLNPWSEVILRSYL